MKDKSIALADYLNSLQIKGRYSFSRQSAIEDLKCSPEALKLAALRLIKKKRLCRPKYGFYVIVPTEYQAVGCPPPPWFIHQLMEYIKQPYYVGILSAAALHGAAHQQPQSFQVLTTKLVRNIQKANMLIELFVKKEINPEDYELIKTPTGYMQVSIPEITAIDLVRYIKSAGHLNNVATVLSELKEKLDENRFLRILKKGDVEVAFIQRLGYLLELVEAKQSITKLIKKWIKKKNPLFTELRPDKSYKNSDKNFDWHLYINENIESDL